MIKLPEIEGVFKAQFYLFDVIDAACDLINNIEAELSNGEVGEETVLTIRSQINELKQALLKAGCTETKENK